ncbi:MAG TPA: hypothetical protein VHA11_07565 [Bryobacteraceae bacterium]|nr:hypothetical protein [Bryobacteraceae bacterium]
MQQDETAERVLDAWHQHVAEIPSTFGRLAFLAGLKNTNTGRYTHYLLRSAFSDDDTDKIIRRTHLQVFAEWLSYTLARQQSDLNLFLSSVEGHRRQIMAACAVLAPHVWCIPDEAAEHERQLYLADLDAILQPIYIQYGLTPGETASKPNFDAFGLPQWGRFTN